MQSLRILVVTGSLAYGMVKEVTSMIKGHELVVYRLEYPVASLMTTNYIARELADKVCGKFDYVLIPGLTLGDASVIKPIVGCEVFKGPRYVGDLPEVVRALESGVRLSTTLPADDVIRDALRRTYESRISEVIGGTSYAFMLGRLGVPLRPPPLLLAYEVMLRDDSVYGKALGRVRKACELGVDLVVVGSPIDYRVPLDHIEGFINEVRYGLGKPVGVDLPPDAISRLGCDFDLLMNASYRTLESLASFRDKAVVVVPSDTSSMNTCTASLARTVELARMLGFTKIVVDPILKPPQLGLAESLATYHHVSKTLNYPLMMGASNVYELMDVDSHSIIALLTSIAIELGISVFLLTEESVKSYNAVSEAVKARNMAYRAYIRRSPPIDVGIDMLVVKEKRRRVAGSPGNCIGVVTVNEYTLQPRIADRYYFKVYVDHDGGYLAVEVYEAGREMCVRRYVGTKPLSILRRVASDYGDSISGEHYAYLGYELCKAELALKIGKSYVQDEPLLT